MDFSRKNFEILLKKERDNATTLEVIQAENSQLKTEVRLLREKVQYLLKKLFGRSSEKLNPDQMELLLEELQEVQEALERAEEKLDEELPVRESRRGKRKPLYRQEMTLKYRHGIEISRKTMGNWMYLIADWLTLIYEALRNEIRQSGYMQTDETFIKYQAPEKETCTNGYLWGYHSPGRGVLFEWFPSRAAECLDSMLTDYEGYMQTDGYAGYTAWLNKPEHTAEKNTILHAACRAHARRKFVETPENSNARKIVKLIAKLYQIETRLRENPEFDRAAHRQKEAVPVLEQIKTILDREQPRQLPQSNFGKAIAYTLERWDALSLYLTHSRLEIDNNLIENVIRPTAIGKKNFLFFGSPRSGQDSAIIYSLIETCRKLGLNPADYLCATLEALPTMKQNEAADWTPARWITAQKQPA